MPLIKKKPAIMPAICDCSDGTIFGVYIKVKLLK